MTSTARLFTATSVPLRYLVIPKCGCTFVKNLLWLVDHGQAHPNPLRVHDDDALFGRADQLGLSPSDIRSEPMAFTVLRNPVDRFLSLYFDKVVGEGWKQFVPLRQTLVRHGLDPHAADKEAHRKNCLIMANWIAENLAFGLDLPSNAHWTPQSWRCKTLQDLDLHLLVLDFLRPQLRALAGGDVPELDDYLESAERNRSAAPTNRRQIVTDSLRSQINNIYSRDRRLYRQARASWEAHAPVVPRYSDLGQVKPWKIRSPDSQRLEHSTV